MYGSDFNNDSSAMAETATVRWIDTCLTTVKHANELVLFSPTWRIASAIHAEVGLQ